MIEHKKIKRDCWIEHNELIGNLKVNPNKMQRDITVWNLVRRLLRNSLKNKTKIIESLFSFDGIQ